MIYAKLHGARTSSGGPLTQRDVLRMLMRLASEQSRWRAAPLGARMLRRLVRLGSLTAVVIALGASPASADEFSQGRTTGGIAYGVSGEVEVRRPGLTDGNYYAAYVGVKHANRALRHQAW